MPIFSYVLIMMPILKNLNYMKKSKTANYAYMYFI